MSALTTLEEEIKRDMSDLELRLSHVFITHLKSAESEGSALEARLIALVKELIMTTATELQGKINSLSDKFAQIEANVSDLVSKSGGTAASAPSGPSVTQEQLDGMGSVVDGLSTRMDTLVQQVVNGAAAPAAPAPAPTEPPPAPVA